MLTTVNVEIVVTVHAERRWESLTGLDNVAMVASLERAEQCGNGLVEWRIPGNSVCFLDPARQIVFVSRPNGKGLECFNVWRL